ncbi:MAG: dihydrofolate reductase [Verrucomicrobiota bacterium]
MSGTPGELRPLPHWSAVVAMDENRVIGKNGTLPWHLPEDLKFFKRLTTGHAIAMGKTTFESIGRPLPNRRNIVVSTTMESAPEGCELVRSVQELAAVDAGTDLFVVGGAQLYEATLPLCTALYVSHVFGEHEGDTHFPIFEDDFALLEVIETFADFEVRRYLNRKAESR